MTCSAPCAFTKRTCQRLCSSSNPDSTLLRLSSFCRRLEIFFQFFDLLRRILLVAFEVGALGEVELRQQGGDLFVAQALVELVEKSEILVEHGDELGQRRAFELGSAFAVADHQSLGGALDHDFDEFALVLDVLVRLALLDAKQRRLRDEDVAALDQVLHVAEEEGQQQGADVGAVHVGVGHEDDFAVANLGGIEVLFRDAGAERGDHGADLFVGQHLVVACFFDVQNFSLEREDGLEAAVAALFGGAAGGFALDQEQLAAVGIALGAVGELAGESAAIERAFAAREVAGFARGFAGAGGVDRLVDDLAGDGRVLLEEGAQPLVDEGLHDAGDIGIQLALGLSFELRLRQLHADDRDQAFADVVAGQVFFYVLEQAHLLCRRS